MDDHTRHQAVGRTIVGGFFLAMGGVHLGLVAADAQVYRHFADGAALPFVRDGWSDIVMDHPATYGLLLMLGEVTAGALLLAGGRAAQVGWRAVILFHLLLMLFGPWTLLWCVPALLILVPLARGERRRSHVYRDQGPLNSVTTGTDPELPARRG